MVKKWENQKTSFPVIDVRNLTTNFLPMILHKAQQVNLNNGMCVVQSFEPKPLYSAIDLKTKLLLSMSNAVGASRFRQATRELIKAYSLGVTVKELDELFSLFAWNQGIGHFSSEIGPSTAFGVYKHIKKREQEGLDRRIILDELMETFGDKNPDVNTLYKKQIKCCEKTDRA